MDRIKLAVIGGGSVNWMRLLMKDLYQLEDIQGGEIRLVDPNREHVQAVADMLQAFNQMQDKDYKISVIEDRREAMKDADFVATTFSPGSMDAFWNDLEIPVKYGIRLPVSMTVGIPGISAALRTVPVAYELVKDMEEMCPGVWLLNVTNPMSAVTGAMNLAAEKTKVVGLCHEFHCLGAFIGPMLGLNKPEGMDVLTYLYRWLPEQGFDYTVAGVNHFIWLTMAVLNGKDVIPDIQEYCHKYKSILDGQQRCDKKFYLTENSPHNTSDAVFALCRQFGYLPLVGDRHLIEFYPSLCNIRNGFGMKYNVKKSTVDSRRSGKKEHLSYVQMIAAGQEKVIWNKSGEEMTDIMHAIVKGETTTAIVNMPNKGQISNMPLGSVVETLSEVGKDGIKPKMSGDLPGAVGTLCRLHSDIHALTVKAALEGDRKLLIEAMSLDPSSAGTDFSQIPDLVDELLSANRQWLPRFFK